MKRTNILILALVLALVGSGSAQAQSVARSSAELIALTPEWKGDRFPDGRPKVSEELLKRVLKLSLEEVWGGLRREGYMNQFSGEWQIIHPDQPMVGRALTAQFMPRRAGVRTVLEEQGKKEGRIGDMVSWPIDMLTEGDIYVADSYSKMNEGPIIGDNLGNALFANSKNGVVFAGTVRDLEGLEEIKGFNGFVKGWHPSYQMEMMLTGIDVPIRIDEVTVMPGDVVLAKRGGVVFIPPHLVEKIVLKGEFTKLRDIFGHLRLREKKYTPGQIDGKWSNEIKQDFVVWTDRNPDQVPMPRAELEKLLQGSEW